MPLQEDCIPPHVDNHDFDRPFCTLSLLSEQSILFGERLMPLGPGEFGGSDFKIPLPPGARLRVWLSPMNGLTVRPTSSYSLATLGGLSSNDSHERAAARASCHGRTDHSATSETSHTVARAGSCLVLKGAGADVAKHCVPPVTARRMSITLRRRARSCMRVMLCPL